MVVVVVGVVVVVVVVVVVAMVVVVVGRVVVVVAAVVVGQVVVVKDSGKVAVVSVTVAAVVDGAVTAAVVSRRLSSSVTSRPEVTSCAASVEDKGRVDTVVGDSDGLTVVVVVVVVDAVVSRDVFLTGTGTVVFHWWLEKGLVMLAGSVTSWSPTVDRRDSGTVGRSQAGRLLIDSSKLELLLL